MIFGNMHLASFGNCKVTKWKNSIYADFDRKELTYRGRLLSAVEVPTLRSIEATVLVRGKDVKEVDKKLADISKWLYDTGTAKLFAERDTTHYYLARCTSVSTPERSGVSARITVKFTCADNRLYNVYNDEPITTATSEMNNFTFAGKHCLNDMGCVFVMESIDAVPKAKLNKYDIEGLNGTLRYDTGEGVLYEEKSLSGNLYFVKQFGDGLLTELEITERMHFISSWLGSSGRAKLILDSDTSRYYEAEVESNQSLTRKDWENGSIKLKMTLQPIAVSIEPKEVSEQLSLTAGKAAEIDLSSLAKQGIGYTSPLKITVQNDGETVLTVLSFGYNDEKNVSKPMRIYANDFSLAKGEAIVIDGSDLTIKKGDTDGISWLANGSFPILAVNGDKKLAIATTVDATVTVTVSCYVRWL